MKFQRIQDLRTDADLSQRELSEILHISQRSYSHYETGSRNIPIENAYPAGKLLRHQHRLSRRTAQTAKK